MDSALTPTLCIAEDRASCEPALQILVASLAGYCPGSRIRLFAPNATAAFRRWLQDYPEVTLDLRRLPGTFSYNVKPQALLSLLGEGCPEVVWIDSDIVICRDFRPLFGSLKDDVLVVTEEGPGPFRSDGQAERCKLWGFEVGRTFPHVLNSCVLRVTPAHRELLQTWASLIESPAYRAQQQARWQDRPLHMLNDQDVLTALLASKRYAQVPLRVLVRGRDIIQFHYRTGYSVRERLRHLFRGMPPFVHSQGIKPWLDEVWEGFRKGDLEKREYVYADLSPYTMVARKYRARLFGTSEWMNAHGRLAGVLRLIGGFHPPLVGLPLAAAFELRRLLPAGGR